MSPDSCRRLNCSQNALLAASTEVVCARGARFLLEFKVLISATVRFLDRATFSAPLARLSSHSLRLRLRLETAHSSSRSDRFPPSMLAWWGLAELPATTAPIADEPSAVPDPPPSTEALYATTPTRLRPEALNVCPSAVLVSADVSRTMVRDESGARGASGYGGFGRCLDSYGDMFSEWTRLSEYSKRLSTNEGSRA